MTDDDRWPEQRARDSARLFAELASHSPDDEAHRLVREQLVELHLPLVRYFARRFAGRSVPMEDLVQVGTIGLIKAVDRFDPTLGFEFTSYAGPTIMGEIKRFLRDSDWLLRVPRRAQELYVAVARARDELGQELGRFPSISEIAERLGVTGDEVAETLDVARARDAAPLDTLLDPVHDSPTERLVAQEEEGFSHIELRGALSNAIECLNEQERQVVVLRFADGKTQSQIADVIGVSQMQVSRILSRSLERMRRVLTQEP